MAMASESEDIGAGFRTDDSDEEIESPLVEESKPAELKVRAHAIPV